MAKGNRVFKLLVFVPGLLAFLCAAVGTCFAQPKPKIEKTKFEATIKELPEPGEPSLIEWQDNEFAIQKISSGAPSPAGVPSYIIVAKAKILKKSISLIFGTLKIKPNADQQFNLRINLTKPSQVIEFVSIDNLGNIKYSKHKVDVAEWEALTKPKVEEPRKPILITPMLGLASVNYKEQDPSYSIDVSNQSGYSLIGQVEVRFPYKPEIDLFADGRYDLLPLKNQGTDYRYAYGDLRGTKYFKLGPKFAIGLNAGVFGWTMSTTDDAFGVTGLGGVEIFPSFEYFLSSTERIKSYLTFTPVFDGLSLSSLSNAFIFAGLEYVTTSANTRTHRIRFDYMSMKYTVDTFTTQASSMVLSYGMDFAF